jgi:hypothetical protein
LLTIPATVGMNTLVLKKTRHWLGAHQMFRQLGALTRKETERYLDNTHTPEDFADRLSYYVDALVRNLHGHHGWEDRVDFPELSAADARFAAGLEILENHSGCLKQSKLFCTAI